MPLHRCMRFLPHHQDTGGFFVCVLEKVGGGPPGGGTGADAAPPPLLLSDSTCRCMALPLSPCCSATVAPGIDGSVLLACRQTSLHFLTPAGA